MVAKKNKEPLSIEQHAQREAVKWLASEKGQRFLKSRHLGVLFEDMTREQLMHTCDQYIWLWQTEREGVRQYFDAMRIQNLQREDDERRHQRKR